MDDSPTETDLVVATTASRILVIIKPDGRLIYGPEYTPDEAASVFWEALARRRADATTKELLFAHMEKLLLAAGTADLTNQVAQDKVNQLAARKCEASERTKANLEASRANEALHQAAYALIELGRSLVLRGAEDPVSEAAVDPTTLS